MNGTAVITTRTTTTPVTVTEVKNGTVMQTMGTSIIVRTGDNEIKMFSQSDIDKRGHPLAANIMRLQLRPVSLEPGLLRYSRPEQFRGDIGAELREALHDTTELRWILEELPDGGEPTLVEREERARADAAERTRAHPLVAATFAAFPGAELIEESESPQVGARQWRNQA